MTQIYSFSGEKSMILTLKTRKLTITTLLALTLFTILAAPNATVDAEAHEEAVVMGSTRVSLGYRNNYLFESGATLVFEAPLKPGWVFDHIEIDFGCEVGGVTGVNVSEIFAVENGYIERCVAG